MNTEQRNLLLSQAGWTPKVISDISDITQDQDYGHLYKVALYDSGRYYLVPTGHLTPIEVTMSRGDYRELIAVLREPMCADEISAIIWSHIKSHGDTP